MTWRLLLYEVRPQKQQLENWYCGAWNRRAISVTEKKLIEDQTGPLDKQARFY
jgi:hypothetical protein